MPEGDILHDTAGDCSDKELLTARLGILQFYICLTVLYKIICLQFFIRILLFHVAYS